MTGTPRPEDLPLDAALAMGCRFHQKFRTACGADPAAFAAWLTRGSVYSLADAGRLALLALDYHSLEEAGLVCSSTAHAFELLELTEADEDLSDLEHIGWNLLRILRPVPPTK